MTTIVLLKDENISNEIIDNCSSILPIKKKSKFNNNKENSPSKNKVITNKIDIIYQMQLKESIKASDRKPITSKSNIITNKRIEIKNNFHLYFLSSNFESYLMNKKITDKVNSKEIIIKTIHKWDALTDKDDSQVLDNIKDIDEDKHIILKNKIIKSNMTFDIKNICIKTTIQISMTGESSLWLFSRTKNEMFNYELDNCAIRITKDLESNRKFIEFGILYKRYKESESNNNLMLKILKKQEIPVHEGYDKKLDISKFSISLVDEGGSSIYVELFVNSFRIKFEANFYVPCDQENTNILIGANGDVICISEVTFNEYMKRSSSFNEPYADKQNCSCCSIY